jgi:hypothetical protein
LLAEKRMGLAVAAAMMATVASAGPIGSIFNPNDYASLGTLDLSSATGMLTVNTDSGNVSWTGSGQTSVPTGSGIGTTAANQSGLVNMGIFTYASVNIGANVTVSVQGNRGLVLASQDSFTFGGSVSVSGTAGSGATIGQGGPGAEGGQRGASYDSDPPGSTAGNGGAATGGNGIG